MESINELLERYFSGETTLAEENQLKLYFKCQNVLPDHEIYRSLFETFDAELQDKSANPMAKVQPVRKKTTRIWIKTFAYTGIAATLLLTLWIRRPQESENYALVGGKRIQDNEYAEKYTAQKLNEIHDLLQNSMKPIHSIEKVRNGLQPIHKLESVNKTINRIENNIQIK